MEIQPIILAAGKGTRMGNPGLPKVLTPLKGRPIISYALETVRECFTVPPAVIVGYQKDLVIQALGDQLVYVEQPELKGTGDAIRQCQERLAGTAEAYLVLNGDHPLFSAETLRSLAKTHIQHGSVMTLVTLTTAEEAFYNFGRILRTSDGKIAAIREYKDCSPEQVAIQEYNVGLYCFSDAWLWTALEKIVPLNAQGEYYLTDLLAIAIAEGRPVESVPIKRWEEALGINTPEQLAEVEDLLGALAN